MSVFHSVSVLAERGVSFREAGLVLATLGVATAIGTAVCGWLSDRTRSLLTVMTGLLQVAAVQWYSAKRRSRPG